MHVTRWILNVGPAPAFFSFCHTVARGSAFSLICHPVFKPRGDIKGKARVAG